MKLKWHNEKRKVDDLISYEKNPRKITEKQKEDLKKSLEKFNLVEVPAINTDNKIIAGHQRLKILQLLRRGNEEVDVRVPNRKLTKKEFEEYNLRSNKNQGDWDYDLLAEFDKDVLEKVGFSGDDLIVLFGLDIQKYTNKIKSPIYKPTGKKPLISELYDNKKTLELLKKIKKANISEEKKRFLELTAYRHIIFNYENIAEFYAQEDKETQWLMEDLALVIIDIHKALEDGFIRFNKDILEGYEE